MNKNKVILLVEDNPDDEKLTLLALRKNNVANEIVVARNGADALDYLFAAGRYACRDHSQMPAVMLLDIHLPKIDGLEVLRRVREDEQLRRLPVVMLTSSKEDKDIVDSYNLGANSYVRKPVAFDEFSDAVRKLGLYWLILNVSPPG